MKSLFAVFYAPPHGNHIKICDYLRVAWTYLDRSNAINTDYEIVRNTAEYLNSFRSLDEFYYVQVVDE